MTSPTSTSIVASYNDGITLTTDPTNKTIQLHVDDTETRTWPDTGTDINNYPFNGQSGANYVLNGLSFREATFTEAQPMAPIAVSGDFTYTPPATMTKTHNLTPVIMFSIAIMILLFIMILVVYRGKSPFVGSIQQIFGLRQLVSTTTTTQPYEKRKIGSIPLILLGASGSIVFALAALRQKYPNTIRLGNEAGAANNNLGNGYGWRIALSAAYLPFSKLGIFNISSDEAIAVSTWCENGILPAASDVEFIHNAIVDGKWTPSQVYQCIRCNYTPSDPTILSSGTFKSNCYCALPSQQKQSTTDQILAGIRNFNIYAIPPLMLFLPMLGGV